MTRARPTAKANEYRQEIHRLLDLLGHKRSAYTGQGYTYSLHKQISRGERPPSPRALAALAGQLTGLIARALAVAAQDPAQARLLRRELGKFDWLQANGTGTEWTVQSRALAGRGAGIKRREHLHPD